MRIKKFLKDNGFIQADVRWNYAVLDAGDLEIHLYVNEGPQFRVADLSVKGVTVFEPTFISSQFNLRPGDIFNISAAKNALERIKQIYADQGYMKLSYIPEMNVDPSARTATMTFTFEEGVQFHVAYVVFVGAKNQAQENRLRAFTNIDPGDIYSAAVVKSDLDQLKKLGVTKNTVEIVDDQRGLIGITFWLRSPQ
jgi:outer membrane protein assembly factor BamA